VPTFTQENGLKAKKQGKGMLKLTSGGQGEVVYEGSWSDDKPEGLGKINYPNGDNYEGEWSGGEKHG